MKFRLSFLTLFFSFFAFVPSIFSQVDSFEVVETMPIFPGGQEAMLEFLYENIEYPKEDLKNGVQGIVIVRFVVNKEGYVKDIEIIQSVSKLIDAEALRVVNAMPRFTPGTQKGKPVNVYFNLPITFKVDDVSEDLSGLDPAEFIFGVDFSLGTLLFNDDFDNIFKPSFIKPDVAFVFGKGNWRLRYRSSISMFQVKEDFYLKGNWKKNRWTGFINLRLELGHSFEFGNFRLQPFVGYGAQWLNPAKEWDTDPNKFSTIKGTYVVGSYLDFRFTSFPSLSIDNKAGTQENFIRLRYDWSPLTLLDEMPMTNGIRGQMFGINLGIGFIVK